MCDCIYLECVQLYTQCSYFMETVRPSHAMKPNVLKPIPFRGRDLIAIVAYGEQVHHRFYEATMYDVD